jgi:peptide/nickel transport system substrate-binding protein
MGLTGGESTNSLDPATWLTQVPQNFGSTWGETIVLQSPEDGSPQPVLALHQEALGHFRQRDLAHAALVE